MTDQNRWVIVCVTDQMHCTRLIHAGEELALAHSANMHVFSVQPRAAQSKQSNALEHLYYTSCKAGADMTVFYDDNATAAIMRFLQEQRPQFVVLGGQEDSPLHQLLKARFPHIVFGVVAFHPISATGS